MIKKIIARILRRIPRVLQVWLPKKHRGNNTPLNAFERKIYSQNGEDGILEEVFRRIGTTNKFFVEFGVQDGSECNTRYLKEQKGWNGVWMDNDDDGTDVQKAFITAENVNSVFERFRIPNDFDLLSIDIDGNDIWVWKSLSDVYRPRVVVIEYNSTVPRWKRIAIPYDPNYVWDETNYFGASLRAMNSVALEKGYRLVCCDKQGTNAFFVLEDVLKEGMLEPQSVAKAFYPVGYGRRKWKMFLGHKPSHKKMVRL